MVERDVAGSAYGIVTEQDIVYRVTATGIGPNSMMVGEIMQQPCTVTSSDISLTAAAREIRDQGLQRMPIVEDGVMVGVVSTTDIVMKSDVASVDLPNDFAERVEIALRHQQLHWNEAEQVNQDSEMTRSVL